MNTGDVLYFHDFGFDDGGHANKLLVILSDPSKDRIAMVITTSKGKDAKNQGCQPAPKRFFVKGGKHGFPKDTWIDLGRNVFVFDTVKVKEKITCRSAEIKMTLPQQILNEIKNCLARHAKESLTREGCELLGIRT